MDAYLIDSSICEYFMCTRLFPNAFSSAVLSFRRVRLDLDEKIKSNITNWYKLLDIELVAKYERCGLVRAYVMMNWSAHRSSDFTCKKVTPLSSSSSPSLSMSSSWASWSGWSCLWWSMYYSDMFELQLLWTVQQMHIWSCLCFEYATDLIKFRQKMMK